VKFNFIPEKDFFSQNSSAYSIYYVFFTAVGFLTTFGLATAFFFSPSFLEDAGYLNEADEPLVCNNWPFSKIFY
jgi:hypothetical protein